MQLCDLSKLGKRHPYHYERHHVYYKPASDWRDREDHEAVRPSTVKVTSPRTVKVEEPQRVIEPASPTLSGVLQHHHEELKHMLEEDSAKSQVGARPRRHTWSGDIESTHVFTSEKIGGAGTPRKTSERVAAMLLPGLRRLYSNTKGEERARLLQEIVQLEDVLGIEESPHPSRYTVSRRCDSEDNVAGELSWVGRSMSL
jgi:hypothetical protein